MPIMNGQISDYLHCIICFNPFSEQRKPFTLICSHTCCLSCLESIQYCPFDQTTINRKLPENEAILGLLDNNSSSRSMLSENGGSESLPFKLDGSVGVSSEDVPHYLRCVESIKHMTSFLKPQQSPLSRPMQRKLISLLHCQLVEGEGRSRAMRNARSIGERALSELLIKHQDPHTLSANLWAAVRARGCQFLGPAMQEEVLRLVLLALEDGSALSRKVLVMFVVQRLSPHFPHQASKTAIGHVIQLLYRASCFKLTKRDGDSSLMQLKEEYCSYEALRREHDTQIVSIALEAGLRISPDQWSSLLYGDTAHKSHMQSIIDKLQSPQSFQQSIQELVIALQRTGDPAGLAPLKEHFEKLASIDPGISNEYVVHPSQAELSSILESSEIVTFRLVEFLQHHASGIFRSSSRPSVAISSSINKNRVPRIKSLTTVATQSSSPIQSLIEKSSFFHLRGKEPDSPTFSSMITNRIINPLPQAPHHLHHHHAPMAVTAPYLIAGHSRFPPREALQAKSIALATIPAILVDPNTGYPSPGSTSLSSPDITGESSSTPVSPISLANSSSPSQTTTLPAALPSDEDKFIPFDERPFVSKYGPISRAMNLINTPTVAGPGINSQRTCDNFVGNSATGTQPTNVILGRTTLPSLTLIQPLQQLVLTATTIPTDAPQNYNHNQATGLSENPYPATPVVHQVGSIVPAVSMA